jgi:DNA-binding YbaB/EbfC family protein
MSDNPPPGDETLPAVPDLDLGGLAGEPGGGFDMGALLQSAMQMQQDLLSAQEQAAEQVVEGVAGGGMVRVEVTGGLEFRRVTIDPQVVDPDEVDLLEDLVLAALHDATGRVQDLQSAAMPALGGLGGLGLDDGGIDLGALLGGGPPAADFDEEDDDDEDDGLDGDDDDGRAGRSDPADGAP